MSAVAISLENMLGRLLLDSDNVSWKYMAPTVQRCRLDYMPKYCRPLALEEFKPVGNGTYNATFSMSAGSNTACERLQSRIEEAITNPSRLSQLGGSEDLDFAHLSQVSVSSKESDRILAEMQAALYAPSGRLSSDVSTVAKAHVDCARRTISLSLVDRARGWW